MIVWFGKDRKDTIIIIIIIIIIIRPLYGKASVMPAIATDDTVAWSVCLCVCMHVGCHTGAPLKPSKRMRCRYYVRGPSNIR